MSDLPSDYRVEIDTYSGPLDLLLYLIRREEVDIYDIPIARITRQYVEYLDLIVELSINVAGEFIVMAATLMEIKSRMMVPQPEEGPEEEQDDPRLELVRQLMEYKRFKEAALALTERAEWRAERFGRPGERAAEDERSDAMPTGGLALWALLDAFSRILEQTGRRAPHKVVLDGTPAEELRSELERRVRSVGRMSFTEAFGGLPDRGVLVGMFLALLELVRQQVLRVEQEMSFGEIWLTYVPEEERPVFEETEALVQAKPDVDEPLPADGEEDAADQWSTEDFSDMDLPEVPDVRESGSTGNDTAVSTDPSAAENPAESPARGSEIGS